MPTITEADEDQLGFVERARVHRGSGRFVSGIFILLVFALHWHLFPVIGNANLNDPIDRLDKLVLPAATLGLVMAAYITRVTRSAML